MKEFLNRIRSPQAPIAARRKIVNTALLLCLGVVLGVASKWLDTVPVNRLPSVLAYLDIGNFLGRFAIWGLIALCISVYSNSSLRAAVNVFAFFVGMVASYYLYSTYVAGFFPKSYAFIWFGFTAASPFSAFVCWYAKGKSRTAFVLSVLLSAVLFNMTFVYGCWYFEARSVLEAAVFVVGLVVLRRSTWKGSALLVVCGAAAALLLHAVLPFHFG